MFPHKKERRVRSPFDPAKPHDTTGWQESQEYNQRDGYQCQQKFKENYKYTKKTSLANVDQLDVLSNLSVALETHGDNSDSSGKRVLFQKGMIGFQWIRPEGPAATSLSLWERARVRECLLVEFGLLQERITFRSSET
ncbi:MAG: hypothetical protein ACE15F_22055 [bacterium]